MGSSCTLEWQLTAGIVSGVYIWNEPLQQATGLRPAPEGVTPVIDWKARDKDTEKEKADAAVKRHEPVDVGKEAGRAADPATPAAGTPATRPTAPNESVSAFVFPAD